MKFQLYSDISIDMRGNFSVPKSALDLIIYVCGSDVDMKSLILAAEITQL